MDLLESGRKDMEEGGARDGVEAAHDPQQVVALALVGLDVHDRQDLSPAFVDRAGPGHHHGDREAREVGFAVVAFLDVDAGYGPAMAVRGARVELAWAAVGAVAVDELAPLDEPCRCWCGRGHGLSPGLSPAYPEAGKYTLPAGNNGLELERISLRK